MADNVVPIPDGEYSLSGLSTDTHFLRVEIGKASLVPAHETPSLGSLLAQAPAVPSVPAKPSLFARLAAGFPSVKVIAGNLLLGAVFLGVPIVGACYLIAGHVPAVPVIPTPKPPPQPPWIPPHPPAPPAPTPNPMQDPVAPPAAVAAPVQAPTYAAPVQAPTYAAPQTYYYAVPSAPQTYCATGRCGR